MNYTKLKLEAQREEEEENERKATLEYLDAMHEIGIEVLE